MSQYQPRRTRISTHALTWRATLDIPNRGLTIINISTHALTWRATIGLALQKTRFQYFYPRPHMEGDRAVGQLLLSLHHFYPRPHMEGDPRNGVYGRDEVNFYPRPHMEGDGYCPRDISDAGHFYPRPRVEGDELVGLATPKEGISTHALA